MKEKPKFPLKVHFLEDDKIWNLKNEDEVAINLEWFDSDDAEENAIVTDSDGRKVRLKVEKLEILKCEIME